MIRHYVILSFALFLVFSSAIYWIKDNSSAKLAEPIEINLEKDDFIIHIRIENIDRGLQVLNSLSYQGQNPVRISHRTPLTSISINRKNKFFTGSPVYKVMDPGDIYHPQEPVAYTSLEEGNHTIYIHTQFLLEGELINLKSHKDIVIQ